jgi:DNA (cytosine-5)-methyltransferase 1
MILGDSPIVVDLFSGAGGLALGFEYGGFFTAAGIDHDKYSLRTFSRNFPKAHIFCENLANPTNELKDAITKMPRVDVVVGGPPCQGFSVAGKRLLDDPRNSLYRHYIEIVSLLKPTYVVMENVPTIRTMGGGAVAHAIVHDLESLKYGVRVETVNAASYGVPQNRTRTFFIAKHEGTPRGFSRGAPDEQRLTTKDAIGDLPLLENHFADVPVPYTSDAQNQYQLQMRKDSLSIYNHWAVAHTERTKSIIALVPDGGNYKNLPKHLHGTRKVNIAWTRMNSQKPSFTIDAGHNHHFHYEANRVPTVRECARIQSFPDTFVFLGNKTSQFRQVGNAVPPLLAAALAKEIRKDFK